MVSIVQEKKKALFALGKPGRAVGTHLRCLEDSVNLYVWFTCSEKADEFKDTLADFFGNIDIQGQKLCDMTPADKKWYQAFRLVHKDFFEFVKAGFPAIMKWSGSDVKSESVYKGYLAGAGAQSSAPAEETKPEEKKQEAAPAKSAPAKASVVPKTPVKVLRFKTWEVSNYVGETITFSGDEVQPGMTFNFFNCEKTKVVIQGKCKNLMLQRCKKFEIKIDEAVSMLEVIKSEGIKVTVEKRLPQVSIELCN